MEITKLEKGDIKAEVKFEKGEVIATSFLDTKGVKAEVKVVIPADYFIDELKKAIPGTLDDTVLELLKTALKAV